MLTTAFVKDARSFIHRNNQPLLSSPSQVVETMYWHEIPDEGYQLTLGPWSVAPSPPTWRKFFVSEGIPHRTESEIEKICSSHFIEPGDFDKPMSVRYWEDWYEIQSGPLARAYHLLQKIDLGPERGSERGTAPRVQHRIPPRRQYTLCQREGYVVAVAFTGPSYRSRHTDQDRGGRLEPRYYRGAKAASARTNNPVSWCGPRRPAREGRHGKHRSM